MTDVRRRTKTKKGREEKAHVPTSKGTSGAGVVSKQENGSSKKSLSTIVKETPTIIDARRGISSYVHAKRKCRRSFRKMKRVPCEAWVAIVLFTTVSSLASFFVGIAMTFRMINSNGLCFVGEERPFSEYNGQFDSNARAQMVYEVEQWHSTPTSTYQDIQVFSNSFFGKVLVVDEEIMITERDERRYHEMIAHVPLAYLSGKDQMQKILSQTGQKGLRVLLIGGGDGGTLLQILKHRNVEKVTVVELDPAVVNTSKTYFPKLAQAFEDDRCNLIFRDGAKYVAERLGMDYVDFVNGDKETIKLANSRGVKAALPENQFELIIVDSTDFGVAQPLFTRQWYMQLQELLVPNFGILTFNVDTPSWAIDTVSHVSRLIASIFEKSFLYQVFMPTYVSGHYSFMFASDFVHPYKNKIDWDSIDSKALDTSYYNKEVHLASFALPNFLKNVCVTDVQK